MSERSQNGFSLKYTDYLESINEKLQVHNEFWSYGENELVGHGKQTNAKCGTFNKFMGCLNFEAHNNARWFVRV